MENFKMLSLIQFLFYYYFFCVCGFNVIQMALRQQSEVKIPAVKRHCQPLTFNNT